MRLTEKIDEYMRVFGVASLAEFSKIVDIPYTTLKGLYTKGYENIQRGNLIKLKNTMQITLDELADDNIAVNFERVKNNAYINGKIDTGSNTAIIIKQDGTRSLYHFSETDTQLAAAFLDRLDKK